MIAALSRRTKQEIPNGLSSQETIEGRLKDDAARRYRDGLDSKAICEEKSYARASARPASNSHTPVSSR